MKPLTIIRREIRGQYRAVRHNRTRLAQLQAESLEHLGEYPVEAIASGDDRLVIFYAFAALLGIAAELLQEALNNLAKTRIYLRRKQESFSRH